MDDDQSFRLGMVMLGIIVGCACLVGLILFLLPKPLIIPLPTARPTETPQITPTSTPEPPTASPMPTMTLESATPSPMPVMTVDPYHHIGGDWPYGIWDFIFDPERGARGHLNVYMGEQKTFIFEIIGAANCSSMPSGQGYLVRYPDGHEEWKDRQAMEGLQLFVLEDDLNDLLRDFDWKFYQCP